MLVIDAANVIGSRPDGWWRDRPGAARAFTERVRAAIDHERLDAPVTIVLEGRSREGVDAVTEIDGLSVVHAPGHGDDTIVAVVQAHTETDTDTIVVTADRLLGERVGSLGARVVRPSWLLDRLTGSVGGATEGRA